MTFPWSHFSQTEVFSFPDHYLFVKPFIVFLTLGMQYAIITGSLEQRKEDKYLITYRENRQSEEKWYEADSRCAIMN